MRIMRMTFAWPALAAALLAVAAPGCGGGGGSDEGGCSRAPEPATGPGDELGYFPVDLGRTWLYRSSASSGFTLTVASTQQVGSETAYVFTTNLGGTNLVAKRPAGVYVLADDTVEPPLDQAYPELILPFPVEVRARTLQLRCTNLDVGDIDDDGKSDRADLEEYLTVGSVGEALTVEAGSFSDVAHTVLELYMTIRSTSSGAASGVATRDDWYARSTGRLQAVMGMSINGMPLGTETIQLASYTVPGQQLSGPTQPGARAAAEPTSSPHRNALAPAEEATSRLLRRVLDRR